MITAQFNDYDAYAQAIERVNARFMMQRLESPYWQVSALTLPNGIIVQHCLSGSGAIARGVSRCHGLELAIPAAGRFTANGVEVPLTDALLMTPDDEFLVTIPGRHRWFNVFVPDHLVSHLHLLSSTGQRPPHGVLANRSRSPGGVAATLGELMQGAIEQPALADSSIALAGAAEALLKSLNHAFGEPPSSVPQRRGRPRTADRARIARAVEFIDAAPAGTIATPQLARLCGLSERALRDGFRRHLGLSPTRYMRLHKLHQARRALNRGNPSETSVARIATDLGLWDLGRFAVRYRELFGELPSTTLSRP